MVHDDWPDDALYAGLVARDAAALEALIRRYMREITYFIRLLLNGVGTAQDAEECANDLFVIVWQEITSYTPSRGSLHTWLTMRAKYIALDRRRQLQRRQSAVTSLDGETTVTRNGETRSGERQLAQLTDHNMEGILEQRERQEELATALNGLPELDRKLVYLRYFRLASTDEISTQTGLSRHAIDTRLWRARKMLRDALEEQNHEPARALKRSRKQ
ncbi:MAG: sigma-70 family RNA polymerase sigma factor [Chloroflexota bacterium]|nr:sigma-70 family RNA polymerase sigma factor [Chloroflexota bacterium]